MAKIINFKYKLSYYLNLIDTRKESNDLWGVLDACRNALNYSKTKIDKKGLEVLIAQTYFDMGLHKLACEHFFRVLKIPELRASGFFGIGRSLVKMNKFDLALEYFDASIKWDFNNQFCGAIFEWTDEIKEKINEPKLGENKLIYTAKNLIKVGQFVQAENILKPLIKINQEASNYYALSYYIKGDIQTANKLNMENLKEPNNLFASCLQYEIYNKLDLTDNAKIIKETISCMNVINGNEKLHQALFFAQLQDFDKAYEILQELQKMQEYIPKTHLFCAISAYNLAKYEDALYYVSRARWLDYENPLYNFYYDIFRKKEIKKPLQLTEKFIFELFGSKLETVRNFLQDENTINKKHHHILLEDLSYAMLNDEWICDKASRFLAYSNEPNYKDFFAKILLSSTPNIKQKFLMCRQALASLKYNEINLVSNYRYMSFYTQKYGIKNLNLKVKNSLCNAIAYCVCFSFKQDILSRVLSNAKMVQNSNSDFDISEQEMTCLFFADNKLILENACIFFGVDENKVIQFKNLLKLSAKR